MSIILEQEFLSQLYIIQDQNPPSQVLFSDAKTIYDIDLNARTVNAPKFLSVSKDHQSETIYFRVNRHYGYMDLFNLHSVLPIQWRGLQGRQGHSIHSTYDEYDRSCYIPVPQ